MKSNPTNVIINYNMHLFYLVALFYYSMLIQSSPSN
jgi:hypothetical protein